MKERPILMSGPMIRAILENRKTQTRRVLKPQRPNWWPDYCAKAAAGYSLNEMKLFYPNGEPAPLPYVIGDSLWVREAWQFIPGCKGDNFREHHYQVKDVEGGIVSYKASNIDYSNHGWKSSIHMPRWASRLTLEVTGVRIEKVQDISEADALAEGVEAWAKAYCSRNPEDELDPVEYFGLLWSSINQAKGYGWEVNPWVWCVSFRRKD